MRVQAGPLLSLAAPRGGASRNAGGSGARQGSASQSAFDQGAFVRQGGVHFRLWAPRARHVDLQVKPGAPSDGTPQTRHAPAGQGMTGGSRYPMEAAEGGYFELHLPGLAAGTRYMYHLDGGPALPDPVSRHQPEGVHGPSEVVDLPPPRLEGWSGVARDDLVFYELHVGTFSPEGTFDGVVPHLAHLRDLGVTAVEIMPVAQCPGNRNWGYDGVGLFAAQASYGGPVALQRLVQAIHDAGMAAILDVVYNHFGPEGNHLPSFGPYLTGHHHTPWGAGVNVDDEGSAAVRRYFRDNVRHWLEAFGFDGLRLDAVHTILDDSPRHILAELAGEAQGVARRQARRIHMVTECSTNDDWMLVPEPDGGRGMSATWADDFHHILDVLVTGKPQHWKKDYRGLPRLARSLREGYVYRDAREHRFPVGRPQPPRRLVPPGGYVVFSHNHDMLGNHPPFQRMAQAVGFPFHRMAAAASILSPHLPLLFMGEEWADPAPFLYFVHHSDPELVEAVRRGRKREFPRLRDPPDPQAESTFLASRLDHRLRDPADGPHASMLAYYRELLRLRRDVPALRERHPSTVRVDLQPRTRRLVLHRSAPANAGGAARPGNAPARRQGSTGAGGASARRAKAASADRVQVVLQASPSARRARFEPGPGTWELLVDSEDEAWGGHGSEAPIHVAGGILLPLQPWQAVAYRRVA